MAVITLTPTQYAALLRGHDCVQAPVAIQGFLYAVVRDMFDDNIYRVAVA